MKDLPTRLATVLREKMDYHKLDAYQVSLAAGVGRATINNILLGKHVCKSDTLVRLAFFLKFDLNQFVTWEDLATDKEPEHGPL